MSSLADETPEGRSVVILAKERYGLRAPTEREMYGGHVPPEARWWADTEAASGGTPLLVAVHDGNGPRVLGLIHLKGVVKDGIRERFAELRRMGIRTVMITGDNPLTPHAIADEAGADDYLAAATPKDKLALIRQEQADGKLVSMTGDGTNDAPALARANVGVAMNTGTSAAKEAGTWSTQTPTPPSSSRSSRSSPRCSQTHTRV